MWSFFLENILFPAFSILPKHRFYKIYKQLAKDQNADKEHLATYSFAKFQEMILEAYQNNPMYRETFDTAGVKPTDIKSPSDTYKIPIITKAIIRDYFPDRAVDQRVPKSKWIFNSTSGSTGTPFEFIMDANLVNAKQARAFFHLKWLGVRPGDRHVKLWGAHDESLFKRLATRYLMRRVEISCFDLDERYAEYAELIRKFKPVAMEAYTSALYKFALLCSENGEQVRFQSAVVSAENLTEQQRELIEETFKCTVFNRYGSREFGSIMQEDPEHHTLHVLNTHFYVEIVDDKGKQVKPGESGRLIVTNFDNRLMPLIRYDTGDMATAADETCKSNLGFQTVKSIDGRQSDFVITPSGKRIQYLYFNYFFEQYGSLVRDFQVIQPEADQLQLKIVPTDKYSEQHSQDIIASLSKNVGADVIISIELVDKIPLTSAGKKRVVISQVK